MRKSNLLEISFIVVAGLVLRCGDNDSLPQPYKIGDFALGGVVYHILQSGDMGYDPKVQHGLVVSIFDQTARWGCYGSIISGADDYLVGSGKKNTLDIVEGCETPGIAARLCNDLNLDGFSDWYLPSRIELYIMYSSKEKIKQAVISNGGDDFTGFYWTSTECNFAGSSELNEQLAGVVNFSYVQPPVTDFLSFLSAGIDIEPLGFHRKDSLNKVRAVRSF